MPRLSPNPLQFSGHPSAINILRTAPCFLSTQLEAVDDTLNRILCEVLNVDLSQDLAWLQASLPICAGGLGVRRATQLVPSAFLASAAGCSYHVEQIIPSSAILLDPDQSMESTISIWSQRHPESPPLPPNSFRQCTWDEPHIAATYKQVARPCTGQSSTPGSRLSRVWSMAECFACCCSQFAYD